MNIRLDFTAEESSEKQPDDKWMESVPETALMF